MRHVLYLTGDPARDFLFDALIVPTQAPYQTWADTCIRAAAGDAYHQGLPSRLADNQVFVVTRDRNKQPGFDTIFVGDNGDLISSLITMTLYQVGHYSYKSVGIPLWKTAFKDEQDMLLVVFRIKEGAQRFLSFSGKQLDIQVIVPKDLKFD